MSQLAYVLAIDDEQDILQTYKELLAQDGVECVGARSAKEALEKLPEHDYAAVLLDQRLRGPKEPATGLDLLGQLCHHAPFAKVLVVTGFADVDSVRRAFDAGAWDYLQKDELLEELLRSKVRVAVQLWRARTLQAASVAEREAELKKAWAQALSEPDKNKKGVLLEQAMKLLFQSLPGFGRCETRLFNELEELDVVVPNESQDPFWRNEGTYLLAECKNWSGAVGVDQLTRFVWKVQHRYDRVKLGFLVAPGGFAATVHQELLSPRDKGPLVLLLDRDDVEALLAAPDRMAKLKELHQRAMVG